MEGLQRSNETFRRSGSSGMVWQDRFLSEELNQAKEKKKKNKEEEEEEEEKGPDFRELRPSRSVGSTGMLDRSRSNGGQGYRTGRVSPALDPPSPKVSACGFCGIFGKSPKPAAAKKSKHTTRR